MKGLIIDLRFDPGGLLDAAVDISDIFLDGGKTIVSIRGRTQRDRTFESKTQASDIKDIPLVVLVNESSASASEIVSGALKDNGRAIIIGTRSFGKGSVQQVRMLESNQGAIKVTNALYYLPSGRNIHRKEGSEIWGVDPTDGYYVPMTSEQIIAMLKLWRDPTAKDAVPAQITPAYIAKEQADPQLAAALEAVVGKLTTGQWPKTGQGGGEALARQAEMGKLAKIRDELANRLEEVEGKIKAMEKGEKVEEKKSDEKK